MSANSPCCGTQRMSSATKRLRPSLTAATRSGRFFRHRRRSHRSPRPHALLFYHGKNEKSTESACRISAGAAVCQKTSFLTDWQRSLKPARQATRTRRRTGGTVEGELRSKLKSLAQQALLSPHPSKITDFCHLPFKGEGFVRNRCFILLFNGWRLF